MGLRPRHTLCSLVARGVDLASLLDASNSRAVEVQTPVKWCPPVGANLQATHTREGRIGPGTLPGLTTPATVEPWCVGETDRNSIEKAASKARGRTSCWSAKGAACLACGAASTHHPVVLGSAQGGDHALLGAHVRRLLNGVVCCNDDRGKNKPLG